MNTRILIAEPHRFHPDAVRVLEQMGCVELCEISSEELANSFKEYDVIWFRLGHQIRRELIPRDPRCRMLVTPVTGLDHIDLSACAEHGITVLSLRGEHQFLRNVRATAELTIGLVLALIRKIPLASISVENGSWDRDEFQGEEIYRKTIGIVGLGRLGSLVAGYFNAFGANVLGYDIRADAVCKDVEKVASLDDLLARSDIVSLHIPLNEDTERLFDESKFSRMKRGAILVNTSRGGVVDEDALLSALQRGQLAGAALDVLTDEPFVDLEHPVIRYAQSHENLLVVPHIGGNTRESWRKTELFLAQKVVERFSQKQIAV